MTSSRRKWPVLFVGIILFIVSGCSTKSAPTLQKWMPTCTDAIEGNLDRLSDNDIERILNESFESNQIGDCWIPLMKRCLDQEREIPQDHLAQAINQLNNFDNKDYFDKSVFRYFSNIDKGVTSYRSEDRELLTAYCRYTIRNASSSQDPAVRNSELLARRLDPDLFDLMFR